jgi:hypothetical protein
MVPSAYLRVYRPIDSFAEPERARWERAILRHQPAADRRVRYRQQPFGDGRFGLLWTTGDDLVEVRVIEGRTFVCPRHERLRGLASVILMREEAPRDVADLLVPEAEAKRAGRELARLRRRDPDTVPTILQSPWHVPVRWFVLFEDAERRLVEAPGGAHRLYYWTSARAAGERIDRAIHALRRSDLEPLVPTMRELGRWLAVHHPRSMVELDYASLSALYSWDELDDDHSAEEVRQALRALSGVGGFARAGELYQSVAGRWAEAKGRVALN